MLFFYHDLFYHDFEDIFFLRWMWEVGGCFFFGGGVGKAKSWPRQTSRCLSSGCYGNKNIYIYVGTKNILWFDLNVAIYVEIHLCGRFVDVFIFAIYSGAKKMPRFNLIGPIYVYFRYTYR